VSDLAGTDHTPRTEVVLERFTVVWPPDVVDPA
jgi:hypothetical protein